MRSRSAFRDGPLWEAREGLHNDLFQGIERLNAVDLSALNIAEFWRSLHFHQSPPQKSANKKKCLQTVRRISAPFLRSGPGKSNQRKGQFMNLSQGQGKTPELTKMGEIHEFFVLALSLVWFAGATPDFLTQ